MSTMYNVISSTYRGFNGNMAYTQFKMFMATNNLVTQTEIHDTISVLSNKQNLALRCVKQHP